MYPLRVFSPDDTRLGAEGSWCSITQTLHHFWSQLNSMIAIVACTLWFRVLNGPVLLADFDLTSIHSPKTCFIHTDLLRDVSQYTAGYDSC